MARPKKSISAEEELLEILRDVRKLLILNLRNNGLSNQAIGSALGVSYKTIERMMPKKRNG